MRFPYGEMRISDFPDRLLDPNPQPLLFRLVALRSRGKQDPP